MTDFYDGARGGIADFNRVPHIYESTFADIGDVPDDSIDVFRLSPIATDLFTLALEDWAIWLRWESAFHRGETPHDTHPALPIDRDRHTELEHLLSGQLVIDNDSFILAYAEFRVCNVPTHSGLGFRPLEVSWSPARPVT